jgi:hypothetical protein
MAGIYSRFGSNAVDRFRSIFSGQEPEEAPVDEPQGIMSRSRFSGRQGPIAVETASQDTSATSFYEEFARMMAMSSTDPDAVADAVLPSQGAQEPDLSGWESLPPPPGRRGDQTVQAFGTVPRRSTGGAGSTPLLDFIASGEGDYNSSNRGTIGSRIVGSTSDTVRNNTSLTDMTIGQIRELQSIKNPNNTNRLFAVGRYQVIPDTLQQAVKDLNLPEDTVFNQETQDRIGMWLINEKRPAVGAFLSGADVPVDEAMMSLAKEFASVPVPYDTVDTRGRRVRAGQSFYHHFGGNRAGHSVQETRNILMQGREQFDRQRPEGALAPLASLTPQPNPSR